MLHRSNKPNNRFFRIRISRFLNIYTLAYVALAALVYTILFAHLERIPLQIWDEAHRAVNAQEILKNNQWLVITFDGTPDLYGTKPPMLVWLQAVFMKLFGIGELAVRLPSALAGLGLCLLIFISLKKDLRATWVSFIAVLVLLSSWGFVYRHGVRFGDTDVLLSFFAAICLMNYYRSIKSLTGKYFYYTFIFMAFATLTKSVAFFMFLPGLLFFTLYKRKLLVILKMKHLYWSVLLYFVIVGSYYVSREICDPGYMKAVWQNEIGGRFFEVNDGHSNVFSVYFNGLLYGRFGFFWVFAGLPILLFVKDSGIKDLVVYIAALVVSYLLMISSSATKLLWYDIPIIPLLSVIAAIIIYLIIDSFMRWIKWKGKVREEILYYLLIGTLFFYPLVRVIGFTFNPKVVPGDENFYHISYFLRNMIENRANFDNTYIIEPEDMGLRPGIPFHLSHMMFYTNILNMNGSEIGFKVKEEVKVGETVITNSAPCKEFVESTFIFEKIDKYENVNVYRISGYKD